MYSSELYNKIVSTNIKRLLWLSEDRLRASRDAAADGPMENIRTLISRISLIMKLCKLYLGQ